MPGAGRGGHEAGRNACIAVCGVLPADAPACRSPRNISPDEERKVDGAEALGPGGAPLRQLPT